MIAQTDNPFQTDLFKLNLIEQLDPKKPLYILAHKIPWKAIEDRFKHLYSNTGQPAHPIRLMTGLLLLQRIFNLSDERLVELWQENPYFQFFCGKNAFQWTQPCASSDLVHFRKRIGQQGIDFLFALSVQLHQHKLNKAQQVIVDSTVQEKNITFPTDAKLYRKVIDTCNGLAKRLGIGLRQSYTFVVKKLNYALRPVRGAKKALKKMRTIAGRQLRDLQRKLMQSGQLATHAPLLEVMTRIVEQERKDKNKVYSLHAPEVSCIAKGKAHQPYEFGSKMSVASLPGSNVVVGMVNFRGNPHDSKTLQKTLEEVKRYCGQEFEEALVDRGYRGHELVGRTRVIMPEGGKRYTPTERRKRKKSYRRRSAIEAVISHLKQGHGLGRNYLKGALGDVVNGLLSGVGWNLKLLLMELT